MQLKIQVDFGRMNLFGTPNSVLESSSDPGVGERAFLLAKPGVRQ